MQFMNPAVILDTLATSHSQNWETDEFQVWNGTASRMIGLETNTIEEPPDGWNINADSPFVPGAHPRFLIGCTWYPHWFSFPVYASYWKVLDELLVSIW